MSKFRVNGTINSDHKFITLIHYEEFTSIVAWYTLPIDFIKSIEEWGYTIDVIRINEMAPTKDSKCWACGLPVEPGERFCNDKCEKFILSKDYI